MKLKKNESIDSFEKDQKNVTEIGISEHHFNDLQSSYRTLASTQLLATFSAIGFIISEMININVAKELLVAAIAFAGLIGILLLWVIDLFVYHHLLDSVFSN